MKFKIFSLGCKVNSYECNAVASALKCAGYEEDNNNPDIVIVNTCSVTATADQKSRQHIRKFQKLYPNAITVVMGCYAQGNAEFIDKEIQPTILIGTSNRNRIVELIEQYQKTHERIVLIDENTRDFKYEELGVTSCSENIRAYLKIQDGCNNFCSYCIIPYRRGKMRSRSKREVLEEARYLVEKGYKEIVLTGIHVGGYGQDLETDSFSNLVSDLLDIKGLESLRISSIEESEIDDDLVKLISTRKNIAHHLHIPLQAGSNDVLKRMNRKYTKEQFIEKIQKIRKALPNIAISTDIIVGFPGETDEDFTDTINVAKTCFDMIHVFPFSARSGTGAARMKDQISPQIKSKRVDTLISLSKELWDKYTTKFIGQEISVLIERFDEEKSLNIGHTSNYIEVAIPSKNAQIGEYVSVKLTKDMIISK